MRRWDYRPCLGKGLTHLPQALSGAINAACTWVSSRPSFPLSWICVLSDWLTGKLTSLIPDTRSLPGKGSFDISKLPSWAHPTRNEFLRHQLTAAQSFHCGPVGEANQPRRLNFQTEVFYTAWLMRIVNGFWSLDCKDVVSKALKIRVL